MLTVFPEIFLGPINETMLKRGQEKGLIDINIVGLREFANGQRRQMDDSPYGGGAGMVLKPEPVDRAFRSLNINRSDPKTKTVFMSPQGTTINHAKLNEFAGLENFVILCGRYKGVDQRIIDKWIDEEISVGDYVLSGGEFPALILIDGISRLIPGVLGNSDSTSSDTFHRNLFDHPTYTRPAEWEGMTVPEVLLNGNHKEIEDWRLKKSIEKTKKLRKDLYAKYLAAVKDGNNE
ncbi:tRNA (guanosine(37)-N1)-methyltransferase TrmD [candidate division KSB1 bacterium]